MYTILHIFICIWILCPSRTQNVFWCEIEGCVQTHSACTPSVPLRSRVPVLQRNGANRIFMHIKGDFSPGLGSLNFGGWGIPQRARDTGELVVQFGLSLNPWEPGAGWCDSQPEGRKRWQESRVKQVKKGRSPSSVHLLLYSAFDRLSDAHPH